MLSTLNVRSQTHNSCEDTVWVHETEHDIIGGVFDGCSTGIKSHFASQALAYSAARNFTNQNYMIVFDDGIKKVIFDLEHVCKFLGLSCMNFLSTALLFFYDKEKQKLYLRCFGDGCIYINGNENVIDQQNTPDYLGYLIGKTNEEKQRYLDKYPIMVYDDVYSFQICSDGIKSITASQIHEHTKKPEELLLQTAPTSANYLTRMWNVLKNDKYTLSDDLSIISYHAAPKLIQL